MGTDNRGRGIFSGVIHGAQISLGVGILAAATAGLIGVLVGAVAGSAGGRIDAFLALGALGEHPRRWPERRAEPEAAPSLAGAWSVRIAATQALQRRRRRAGR